MVVMSGSRCALEDASISVSPMSLSPTASAHSGSTSRLLRRPTSIKLSAKSYGFNYPTAIAFSGPTGGGNSVTEFNTATGALVKVLR